ncbi:Uncharacterized protein APZ42_011751 [Daphnia magna]|uniref:Uncharacterized protein n=1 Tax=Daphnia magna TaxID=35525 RepID=A0A162SYS7_9CRUS|nr:Uncharacterized protein APZ42_011751 [Daphnia magna]
MPSLREQGSLTKTTDKTNKRRVKYTNHLTLQVCSERPSYQMFEYASRKFDKQEKNVPEELLRNFSHPIVSRL